MVSKPSKLDIGMEKWSWQGKSNYRKNIYQGECWGRESKVWQKGGQVLRKEVVKCGNPVRKHRVPYQAAFLLAPFWWSRTIIQIPFSWYKIKVDVLLVRKARMEAGWNGSYPSVREHLMDTSSAAHSRPDSIQNMQCYIWVS